MKEKLDKIIHGGLKKPVFTACSVGYFHRNKEVTSGDIVNYGCTGDSQFNYPVDNDTVFDLASLTKPLVTSLSMLALLQEGKLKREHTLKQFFQKSMPGKENITLSNLLSHSSGLPAHRPYYKKLIEIPASDRMERLVGWILDEQLVFQPGTENLYSDLGFILLGRIIEMVSGESLDEYWQKKIIKFLHLDKGLFFAGKRKKNSFVCAATGRCCWSNSELCGVVNDDNCRALGGVAGHAGLFGSAGALLSLCEEILLQFRGDKRHVSYSSENLRKVLKNKQGSWVFGFDTPSGFSSSGKYFSDMTIGHLGFTGTSFWIDLQREIAIVLLTNRVSCGESLEPIKKLRPIIHDTIMEFLIKT